MFNFAQVQSTVPWTDDPKTILEHTYISGNNSGNNKQGEAQRLTRIAAKRAKEGSNLDRPICFPVLFWPLSNFSLTTLPIVLESFRWPRCCCDHVDDGARVAG